MQPCLRLVLDLIFRYIKPELLQILLRKLGQFKNGCEGTRTCLFILGVKTFLEMSLQVQYLHFAFKLVTVLILDSLGVPRDAIDERDASQKLANNVLLYVARNAFDGFSNLHSALVVLLIGFPRESLCDMMPKQIVDDLLAV